MTKRRLFQGMVIVVVLGLQWFLVAVWSIDAENFELLAQEVERDGHWRYGIARTFHDFYLVKTRLTADAPSFVPPAADDELARAMVRELYWRPWKAALEVCFYGALWILWTRVIAPSRRRFMGDSTKRWQRRAVSGLSWIAMSSAMLAPFIIAEYGLVEYASGVDVMSASAVSALSGVGWGPYVSYKILLFYVIGPPLMALSWTEPLLEPFLELIGGRASMWLACAVFYGVVGAAIPWIVERLHSWQGND